MSSEWDIVKAQLERLAADRQYKPVDEILKSAGSVPIGTHKTLENKALTGGRKSDARTRLRPVGAMMADELKLWWKDRDEQ